MCKRSLKKEKWRMRIGELVMADCRKAKAAEKRQYVLEALKGKPAELGMTDDPLAWHMLLDGVREGNGEIRHADGWLVGDGFGDIEWLSYAEFEARFVYALDVEQPKNEATL